MAIYVLELYLLIINIVAFATYGIDKWKAKNNKWRISEATLLGMAIIGGSIGAYCGMMLFHHKTRHWYFRYGIPAIIVLQAVIALLIKIYFLP